jgi:hypothetical protein
MLFTNSVFTHLLNPQTIGFEFYEIINEINKSFQSVVIPAANWIYLSPDFGFLADQLEKITVPICCIGLGSQLTLDQLRKLPEGNLRLLKVLSKKCDAIGVRGEKTREILDGLGISNSLVLGCPSIFPHFQPVRELCGCEPNEFMRLSISFTRFGRSDLSQNCFQRRLASLAAHYGSSIVLQSEQAEINCLEAPDQETAAWLCSYYGIAESELGGLLSRMYLFNSQESWVKFHRENTDFTISSRIHGCIASLLAGKPALLLAHDQRTAELAETMGIPHRPIDCIVNIQTKEVLLNLIRDLDYTDFFGKQITNLEKLKHLYKTCGVQICI